MSPEYLMPPSRDDGHFGATRRARRFDNRSELRNSSAGNHSRGANRARSDADFQAVDSQRNQIFGCFISGDVAGDNLHFRQTLANRFDRVHHFCGVAMSGVDSEHIRFRFRHFDGAFQKISGCANRGVR